MQDAKSAELNTQFVLYFESLFNASLTTPDATRRVVNKLEFNYQNSPILQDVKSMELNTQFNYDAK